MLLKKQGEKLKTLGACNNSIDKGNNHLNSMGMKAFLS